MTLIVLVLCALFVWWLPVCLTVWVGLWCVSLPPGFCSLFGNGTLLYVSYRKKHMLKPAEYFIVNLAISDLGLTLSLYPMAITSSLYHRYCNNTPASHNNRLAHNNKMCLVLMSCCSYIKVFISLTRVLLRGDMFMWTPKRKLSRHPVVTNCTNKKKCCWRVTDANIVIHRDTRCYVHCFLNAVPPSSHLPLSSIFSFSSTPTFFHHPLPIHFTPSPFTSTSLPFFIYFFLITPPTLQPSQVAVRQDRVLRVRLLWHVVRHLQSDHSHLAEHGVFCESVLSPLW